MQITLNIPDNTSMERVQQVIDELAGKLQLQIDVIGSWPTLMASDDSLKEKLAK